ncbi:NACHT, LRR and PYD domains-containing protein 3 [Kappamyces sp. JEL0829]|nr:NACHT, LRR and PYD domains-containing protein 3 [Kappamyces sp. JEL0829]
MRNIKANAYFQCMVFEAVEQCLEQDAFDLTSFHSDLLQHVFAEEVLHLLANYHHFARIDLSEWPELFVGPIEQVLHLLSRSSASGALEELWLHSNLLDDEQLEMILDALDPNSLEFLSLADNTFDREGLGHLAAYLSLGCRRLQGLHLSDNALDPDSFKLLLSSLADSSISELHLKNCALTLQHATALSGFLCTNRTLRVLKLARNQSLEAEGIDLILGALVGHPSLQELYLAQSGLSDSSCAALGDLLQLNPTLLTLDLSFSSFMGVGLHAVAAALESNRCLRNLMLFCCNTSDENILALAHMLRTNRSLSSLNLGSALYQNYDIAALADALRHNSTLDYLFIAFDEGSVDGVPQHQYWVDALGENRSLLSYPEFELNYQTELLERFDRNERIEDERDSTVAQVMVVARKLLLFSSHLPFDLVDYILELLFPSHLYYAGDILLLKRVLLCRESLGALTMYNWTCFGTKNLVRACHWFLDDVHGHL